MSISKWKPLGIAFIRTSLVPPVGGFVLKWFLEKGVDLSEKSTTVNIVTFTVLSGIYYLLFHFIETVAKNPRVRKWAGIALGYPSRPKYIQSHGTYYITPKGEVAPLLHPVFNDVKIVPPITSNPFPSVPSNLFVKVTDNNVEGS
jgi:hypothetical protein